MGEVAHDRSVIMVGVGSEAGRPDGVHTFVFTDIEDSTATWEREPQAMAKAVARQVVLIDEVAARHGGGRELEQGAGDSTVLAFARPSDALRAVVELQQALAAEHWPTTEPVRVRVAVHTGEVHRQDDDTITGPTMNRCGRLLSAAHGGQIVASAVTVDLAGDWHRDDGGSDADVLDLGAHRLRGVELPMRIVQVTPHGLPRDFPPLRTLDGAAALLPRHDTDVIGQEDLLAEMDALVRSGGVITLVGTGGCGKTRVATEAAARAVEVFRDGTAWVDLASVGDRALVDDAAAAAMGVRGGPRPARDRLLDHLHDRHALVVVDNCEHVIDDAADLVAAIHARCPRVTVVATSREPLNLTDEIVRRVPSLSLPDAPTVESITRSEAGRLLIERGRRVRPDFIVTADDAAAVVELCRSLDGIPLALELAASRLRALSVQAVVDGLAARFQLLTGGGRNVLARQRTLEASVAWSHQLLDETEATVFRRLSVFATAFTMDAALAVTGDDLPERAVRDAVIALVDRSLLQAVADGRFRMLETLRHYARERLLDADESTEVRARHLTWFAALAHDVGEGLEGIDVRGAVDAAARALDDLRAAMAWAVQAGRGDDAVAIIGSTTWFWILRARVPEAMDWIDRAAAPTAATSAVGTLHGHWAALQLLAHHDAEPDAMQRAADAGLALARELGDATMEGRLTVVWGAHVGFTDPTEGLAVLEAGRALTEAAGDDWWGAYAEGSMALCHVFTGRDDLAVELLGNTPTRRRTQPSTRMRIEDLTRRTFADYSLGRYDAVVDACTEVEVALAGVSEINLQGSARAVAGWVGVERGAALDVIDTTEALLHRYLREQEVQHVPPIILALAQALLAGGRHQEARERLLLAWPFPQLQAFVCGRLWFRHDLALAELVAGDSDAAYDAFAAMHDDAARAQNVREQARARFWLGTIARSRGEHAQAEDHLHAALETHVRHGYRQMAAAALEAIAGLELDHDRAEAAARLLGAGAAVRAEAGVVQRVGWQDRYERDLAAARDTIDGAAFEREWHEGAAAGLEDAVALARRGRGERGRPSFGWDSLTTTEQRVAALVAEGRTNPQIAEALLMGRETVKSHVSSILRKLGLANRTQVASALATRNAGAEEQAAP